MVRVGADRRINTWRLGKIGRGISRSQDSNERDASKPGLNQDPAVTATPDMPLKRHLPRHLPHLTCVMIEQQFWLPNFSSPSEEVGKDVSSFSRSFAGLGSPALQF